GAEAVVLGGVSPEARRPGKWPAAADGRTGQETEGEFRSGNDSSPGRPKVSLLRKLGDPRSETWPGPETGPQRGRPSTRTSATPPGPGLTTRRRRPRAGAKKGQPDGEGPPRGAGRRRRGRLPGATRFAQTIGSGYWTPLRERGGARIEKPRTGRPHHGHCVV